MQTAKQYAPEVVFHTERALRQMPMPLRLPQRPDLPTSRQDVEGYVGKLLSIPADIGRDVEELKAVEEFLSPDTGQTVLALTYEEQRVCDMATD